MDLGVHYFQTNPHWTMSSISHYIPVKLSSVSQWYPEINPYPCWINLRCHQTRLAGKSTSNSSMIFPAINLDLVFGFSSQSCWSPEGNNFSQCYFLTNGGAPDTQCLDKSRWAFLYHQHMPDMIACDLDMAAKNPMGYKSLGLGEMPQTEHGFQMISISSSNIFQYSNQRFPADFPSCMDSDMFHGQVTG